MKPAIFAMTAFASVIAAGCFSTTHAEDPIPGAVQRSAVLATDDGRALKVHASALLPLDEVGARAWVDSLAGTGLWAGAPSVAENPAPADSREDPLIEVAFEAPGWTRVTVETGAFPVGSEGDAAAEELRIAWVDELRELRKRVEQP